MRARYVDAGRGLLVAAMVYGHVMQFFADTQIFPLAGRLVDGINLLVFPSFVFFFGVTAALAYLSRPFSQALPGMVRTAVRAWLAFVLSGVAYRVLRENRVLGPGTVRRILWLSDIPGWSEFLVSFALYGLLLIAGFALLRRLTPFAALLTGALCVGCCLIPYDRVQPVQLQLLIGGRDFSCFPVVQYMPYFLAGIVYARGDARTRRCLAGVAALATAVGVLAAVRLGRLPERFPPHWGYILLPALGVAGIVGLSHALCALGRPGESGLARIPGTLCAALERMGGASLFYLLSSNLLLFTMAGRGIAPQMAAKSILPWTLPIQSPMGALCWTVILLLAIAFVGNLAGRGGKRRAGICPSAGSEPPGAELTKR